MPADLDVLIVGAGPVGLFLANECACRSFKLAQALRDAVIPMVSRLAQFQHAFVERLSELGNEITLVRPDGYAAFSAGIQDGMRAIESVRSILERPTRPG